MTRLSSEICIQAQSTHVWCILADLGAIENFNPSVRASRYISEQRMGPGAARRCELRPMGALEETIIEWKAGEAMTLKMHSWHRTPPFHTATVRFAIAPQGSATLASCEVNYCMKWGPFGRLIDRWMVRPKFRKVVAGIVQGLKHYCETGEAVTPEVWRRVRAL